MLQLHSHMWNEPWTRLLFATGIIYMSSFLIGLSAAAKSLQLCLTLCDPIDGSTPDSLVPRILQARTLEWVVISFSNAWKWKVKEKSLSRVRLFGTPWTVACQAPLSMRILQVIYTKTIPGEMIRYLGFALK